MNKVYACSDIHGHYSKLEKVLDMLDDTDKLYIVGDIVDKGPDPIKCIQKVMEDKRCELLIGNHDLMFLCYELYRVNKAYGNTLDRMSLEVDYIKNNAGWLTDNLFAQLSHEEQREIVEYLKSCYIQKVIEVDGKRFVLVHAVSLNNGEEDVPLKMNEKFKIYDWTDDYDWARIKHQEILGKYLITGHDPVPYRSADQFINNIGKTKWEIYRKGNFFDLDCGLAVFGESANLGVICLNDFKEYYF